MEAQQTYPAILVTVFGALAVALGLGFSHSALAFDAICGDVNASESLTASDALEILKAAVGQKVALECPAPASPTQTGQANCYYLGGQGSSKIDCLGTGQDGELQKGVSHSFTDNGDGTITDNVTGLMWEKLSNDGGIHDRGQAFSWSDASATKIAALNSSKFAGHSDWRLPNRFELETLIELTENTFTTFPEFNGACPDGCAATTCSCAIRQTPPSYSSSAWSSSSVRFLPAYAWFVDFENGFVDGAYKSGKNHVRAVRDAP